MKNLILDCSCGMSVYVENDGVVYSKVDASQNKHSDEILVAVDELLKSASLVINQIDNICVCIGPGSFTGIRVAISLAKGLAIGVNAKVFVLSNFDIFDVENNQNYYLILDGFSSFVYVRKYENGFIKDDCLDVNCFAEDVKKDNFVVYVTTEKTQNLLKKVEIQSKIAQSQTIFAFNQQIKSKNQIDLNKINPIYLRASQAEIERLKKK